MCHWGLSPGSGACWVSSLPLGSILRPGICTQEEIKTENSFPCEISVNLVHSDKGKSLLVPKTELSPIGQIEEAVSAGFLSKPVTRTIKVSELTTETDSAWALGKACFFYSQNFPWGLATEISRCWNWEKRREFTTHSFFRVSAFIGDWTPTVTASLWPSSHGSLGVQAL